MVDGPDERTQIQGHGEDHVDGDLEEGGVDPHAHPELAGLDDAEFHRWLHDTYADPLFELLEARRNEVVARAWELLGGDGLLQLFGTVPRADLEKFLRDFRTSAPRRPGLGDARSILREGKTGGVDRMVKMLNFLGQRVATEALDAVRSDDATDVETLRINHDDSTVRGSLIGCTYRRGPFPAATNVWALASLGLLGPDLDDDPQIAQLAAAFVEAVETRRSQERAMEETASAEAVDESGRTVEAAELAGALIAAGCELEVIAERLGAYRENAPRAAASAHQIGEQLAAGLHSDPGDRALVEDAWAGADALAKALAPALEMLGAAAPPPIGVVVEALALGAPSTDDRLQRLAAVQGPAPIEGQLAEIRQAATDSNPEMDEFLLALEALIDAAAEQDADPNVLSSFESAAREADGGGNFSATLTAAVRGALHIEEPIETDEAEPEGGEANGSFSEDEHPDRHLDRPAAVVRETPVPSSSPPAAGGTTTGGVGLDNAVLDPVLTEATPQVAAVDEEAALVAALALEEQLVAGVVSALDAGELSLAAWASVAAAAESGVEVPETAMLQTAALAAELKGPGPLAKELVTRVPEVVPAGVTGSEAVQLCAWASALRASVIAPETGLHELAANVAQRLEIPALSTLSDAVVSFARRGLSLLRASFLSTAGDLSSLEESVRLAADTAAEQMVMRQFNFALAGRVWKDWIRPDGALGALNPATNDHRDKVAQVRAAATELKSRRTLERALNEAQHRLREKSTTKSIEGTARQALLRHGADAAVAALAWCDAVDALLLRQTATNDSDEEAIDKLMRVANAARAEVFVAVEERGPGTGGARILLKGFYDLLAGKQPQDSEPALDVALHRGLLFGDQALGPNLDPVEPISLSAILAGHKRGIDTAFEMRVGARDLVVAYGLAELARAAALPGAADMAQRCDEALVEGRTAVGNRGHEVASLLDRARRQLYVSEDAYAALSGRLARAITLARRDIGRQLSELEVITSELSSARADAVERFAADARGRCGANPEALAKVLIRVEEGDLATATELLQQAERGEDLSSAEEEPFAIESVFPLVPDALGESMRTDLIDAARARGTSGPLSFAALNERAAADVTAAFEAWSSLHSASVPSDLLAILKPVLRLMGIEAGALDRRATYAIPSAPQRRWFDLTEVSRTGKALVPFFGSSSEARLRCVWVAGAPGAETLCEWLEQDRARLPVLVLHPGVMSMATRLALARIMRRRGLQPAVVADDAVVAWLGTLGQSRFEPFMSATLPFSSGNPYMPPSGDCPVEMFYGRSAQLAAVQAIGGTCLVYGGRQLGKSALLHTAEREFNLVHDQVAVYVNLKPPIDESGRPEVVWSELAEKLTAAGVVTASRAALRDPIGAVSTGVNAWLDEHPQGRILVLLDEADRYFDLDVQANFVTTSQLKDLMDEKGRRFKVVWTGLHQVRRFATVSNHPIAHLGSPAVIGFLDPAPAHRLIERPSGALGLRFAGDALVSRILAYCNYQPALLHLFAHALVERMCVKGAERLKGLPLEVNEADVEEVAGSPAVQEAIKEKIELTLELDPRYKVITYTLAFLAHERGPDVALSAPSLRAEVQRWWSAGFAAVDASEFRSLLEELAGLGVLSADPGGAGWRLRSANVLRLLGTAEQVEDALLQEEEREPVPLESSEVRERLSGIYRSPITRAQLADLIGSGPSQALLVVGSAATCAGRLGEALDTAAAEKPPRFTLSRPKNLAGYRKALVERAGDLPHVVVSDLRVVQAETCTESLRLALERPPDAPRASVALLVDAAGLSWWLPAVAFDAAGGVGVLALRRLDRLGARAWSAAYEHVFQDESSRQDLMELTGGWPVLFERADELIAASPSASSAAVLEALRAENEAGQHDEVLASVLSDAPPSVHSLFDLLAANPAETASASVLAELVEDPSCDAVALVEGLRTLGALAVGVNGELGAEPVLARAWAHVGHDEVRPGS